MINAIINNKIPCYFISPHLDDAMFSAGGLIHYLSGKTPVTVVNVFTSAGDGVNTLSASAFLRQCGYKSPQKLFSDRISEDKRAFSGLSVKRIDLDHTDALWRRKTSTWPVAELNNMYPTYRYHIISGKISKYDRMLMEDLQKELQHIVSTKNYRVFCPAGFGNHVDHVLVRDVCTQTFDAANIIYWSDFPYVQRNPETNPFIEDYAYDFFDVTHNKKAKIALCKKYTSQFELVIPDESKITGSERYFTHGNLLSKCAQLAAKKGISSHIRALFSAPLDYLFNLVTGATGNVQLQEYSKKQQDAADTIVSAIVKVLPQAKPVIIGSTGLQVIGLGDLDILIPASSGKLSEYCNVLSRVYGTPAKVRKDIIQWKLNIQGHAVDLDLISDTSHRFKLQTQLFTIFKTHDNFKNAYVQFKKLIAHHSLNEYAVARINFFTMILNEYKRLYNFPERIGQYTFVSAKIIAKRVQNYAFALYKNTTGDTFFVKRCSGIVKSPAYYALKNEFQMYTLLHTYTGGSTIRVAKPADTLEEKHSLYAIYEYMQGDSLAKQTSAYKADVFAAVIQFLSRVTAQAKPDQLSKMIRRTSIYWVSIFPFLCMRACIQHPSKTAQLFRSFLFVLKHASTILRRTQTRIVHRDLNDWAIISKENGKYLIDFQLTCVADPLLEYAVLLTKYNLDSEFTDALMSTTQYASDVKSDTDLLALGVYKIIISVYDLALVGGHHDASIHTIEGII